MKKLVALSLTSLALSVAAAAAVAQDQRPQLSEAEVARRSGVIARVGDVRITIGDVEDAINQQQPFLRASYQDPEKRREFVENMIRFELLAREAQKRGYDKAPNVAQTVKQNAVQYLVRREFDERSTIESVPDADVQAYYDAHPEEFNRGEMVRASHIQVATEAEARELMTKARAGDAARFRELAREHSTDTETKQRGGDLRYFAREPVRGDPNPPVDATLVRTAFALHEVGDVSEPVQVGNAWSIVMLTGRRPAESRPLAEAAPTIKMRLWRERRQSALDNFVEQLRQRVHPEVHAERMNDIHFDQAELDPTKAPAHDHGGGAGPAGPPRAMPAPGAGAPRPTAPR